MSKKKASKPKTEWVSVLLLKPHPKNYRSHPPDQLDHIAQSIAEHGFYRNVVIARDGTILAGHGVVAAVLCMGLFGPSEVPVIRLDVGPDDPAALKVMTGDNEIGLLADVDDRALTSVLKELTEADGLGGTGYNTESLMSLLLVSRSAKEIADPQEASHWIGMPGYESADPTRKLLVTFDSEDAREEFVRSIGVFDPGAPSGCLYRRNTASSNLWSLTWPLRPRHDNKSVKFQPSPSLFDLTEK